MKLTKKRERVYLFIKKFIEKNGYPPTMIEIGKHMGVTDSAANQHVQALQKMGYVSYQKKKQRTLRIVK